MSTVPSNNLLSALAQLRQPGPVVATRPPASRAEPPPAPPPLPADVTPPGDNAQTRRLSPLGQRVDIRV